MKLPIDNEDGLIIKLSVMRKGKGHEIEHFMEEKHLQNEGELQNVAKKAVSLLWESYDLTKV